MRNGATARAEGAAMAATSIDAILKSCLYRSNVLFLPSLPCAMVAP